MNGKFKRLHESSEDFKVNCSRFCFFILKSGSSLKGIVANLMRVPVHKPFLMSETQKPSQQVGRDSLSGVFVFAEITDFEA